MLTASKPIKPTSLANQAPMPSQTLNLKSKSFTSVALQPLQAPMQTAAPHALSRFWGPRLDLGFWAVWSGLSYLRPELDT